MKRFDEAAAFLRQHEVGRGSFIETPYGRRLLTYADLTATGRFLHFVEAWVAKWRPYYANSHTVISSTGRAVTQLREEARQVIRRCVNAGANDEVIFVGSGATSAVNKLVGLLGWRISEPLEREHGLSKAIPREKRPVVFLGPYEHHSNELPWLESVADVVEIDLNPRGTIDLADLERKLARFEGRSLKLGSFSAASNVTGVLSPVKIIARMLHQHQAWACFDYAAGGPYLPVDMHPADELERLDAVYFSTHKFVGGPEGSGVLVADRSLFRSRVPERPGGGTVDYVAAIQSDLVDYVRRLDEREEGGTPDIVGDARAAVAFMVKEFLGPQRLLEHELHLARTALARLSRHPLIEVLGPLDAERLPILSFNVKCLHHDFVSALLDHLFGIQNRAGCACAGPYGHRLLGIDRKKSEAHRKQIARGVIGLKPGWVRVTLPLYASADDVEFMLSAIEFVAEHGHRFLSEYTFGWLDGVWRHVEQPVNPPTPVALTWEALVKSASEHAPLDTPISEAVLRRERLRYFEEARARASMLGATPRLSSGTGQPEVDALVWFDAVHTDAPWQQLHAEAVGSPQ